VTDDVKPTFKSGEFIPSGEPSPTRRSGTRFIGKVCCAKAQLATIGEQQTIVIVCPDHPPMMLNEAMQIVPLQLD